MFEGNARPMVYEFGEMVQPGLCGDGAGGCAIRRDVPHETKG